MTRLHLILTVIAAACALTCQAATPADTTTPTDNYRKASFAWGAELSGAADMSQHNMSAVGISAEFGFRYKWVRFLGIGAEGNTMVNTSDRTFPLYINFRTDFSNHRRLLFVDLRGGMALNYLYGNTQKTGAYASGGVGITLAGGKKFSSHIILAYTYIGNDVCYYGDYMRTCPGISQATLRLGVIF